MPFQMNIIKGGINVAAIYPKAVKGTFFVPTVNVAVQSFTLVISSIVEGRKAQTKSAKNGKCGCNNGKIFNAASVPVNLSGSFKEFFAGVEKGIRACDSSCPLWAEVGKPLRPSLGGEFGMSCTPSLTLYGTVINTADELDLLSVRFELAKTDAMYLREKILPEFVRFEKLKKAGRPVRKVLVIEFSYVTRTSPTATYDSVQAKFVNLPTEYEEALQNGVFAHTNFVVQSALPVLQTLPALLEPTTDTPDDPL